MSVEQDERESSAAHVYIGNTIIFTVIIEPVLHTELWHIMKLKGGVLATAGSYEEAQELADMLILGVQIGHRIGRGDTYYGE